MLDIHSHILPDIDDGARDIETAVKLLEMMGAQGITDVIATPHFDARQDDIGYFKQKTARAKEDLELYTRGCNLPNIYMGSEVYYFKGMGKTQGLYELTLANTRYILVELPSSSSIDSGVLRDIADIYDNLGLVPIIAHIERYYERSHFRELCRLISNGSALSQINAQALLSREQGKICKKLIRRGLVTFVATDAHSLERRPPLLAPALGLIADTFGERYRETFIRNSERLCEEIKGANEKQHT